MLDTASPHETPEAVVVERSGTVDDIEYVGFWSRVLASLIDTILLLAIIYPMLYASYGGEYFTSGGIMAGTADLLLNYVFPAIAVIIFWVWKSATPGKMLIKARIVDADTLGKPSTGKMISRYLGYYVSMLPLFLGIFWVAFDNRKQGWHDKLAGTLVIRQK